MRKKIQDVRIMRKSQKILRIAPIAASCDFPIASVPLAAHTKAKDLQLPLKIGVDLMGNDNNPHLLIEALQSLTLPPGIEIVLIGLAQFNQPDSGFDYIAVKEFIGMEEHPLRALRKKKGASIPVGLRLLKAGKLDAFVSAGNTGALVSSAKMILSTFPKILRPCLLTLMPTKKNPVAVLDVGANVQAKARHLVQFASIGAAFQKARGIQNPVVGLLNIGSEPLKGTSELRIAYNALQKEGSFSFLGNIEGKEVFDGNVDVLVTDGFTGNIFLKTAEGIASLILDRIERGAKEAETFHMLHYSEYPGALLAAVRGVVIKCHGYSTPKGFTNAVLGAAKLAKEQFVQKLLNDLR